MNLLETIVVAIVEGLTEFLPVSSTGHMIIAEYALGIKSNEFVKAFTVSIQFGAILSVVLLYWRRFFTNDFSFYFKLFVAFLPAAVIGFLADDYIDSLLGDVMVVAVSLILGGIILIFIDKIINQNNQTEVKYKNAFIIGFFQCLAMIPGVSRSAATIIGGMAQKLTRKAAAEFSFFLAVPTMLAASGYKLLKSYELFKPEDYKMLAIGNVVAFVVALFAIKFFISFLTKHGFKIFGYYRIALGLVLIILYFAGFNMTLS